MDGRLPLPTLLSHLLVAFAVEFDNEFEHQMPHRTTNHDSSPDAPWLVSMAMWFNFLQFVDEDGVTLREFQRRLRIPNKEIRNWLTRLADWWGYLVVESIATRGGPQRIRSDATVRFTPAGRRARAVWWPLADGIEKRWQERFGADEIARLRELLQAVVTQIAIELPECLPILGYGMFSRVPEPEQGAYRPGTVAAVSHLPLPVLLSKVLLAFAIEFERDSKVSLAISANVLRLAVDGGVRVRDLPRLAAVSKEAITMSLSFLEKRSYAAVRPELPNSRVKVLVLTPKGRQEQDVYRRQLWVIERGWETRFGKDALRHLRELLERIVGEPTSQTSPLFRGLQPYPDGWRASIPKPEGLPHYPMILHRGGFPDGS
jgi:DNA-binding MarR family transcriptional regulator